MFRLCVSSCLLFCELPCYFAGLWKRVVEWKYSVYKLLQNRSISRTRGVSVSILAGMNSVFQLGAGAVLAGAGPCRGVILEMVLTRKSN
jgi:hypothetical protein